MSEQAYVGHEYVTIHADDYSVTAQGSVTSSAEQLDVSTRDVRKSCFANVALIKVLLLYLVSTHGCGDTPQLLLQSLALDDDGLGVMVDAVD